MDQKKERLVPPCPKCVADGEPGTCVRKHGTYTASGAVRLQVWHCRDCGHIYRTPIDEELAKPGAGNERSVR
jgi:uncharacterized Zn finger protein